jgi:hypothetical protein
MQMSPPRFVDFSLPSSNRDFCFPRSPRLLLPRKPTKIISPFLSFVENSQKSLQVPGGEGRERELSAREARGRRRRRRQWGSRGCCRSWSQSWRPLARWSCGARRWLLTPIPGSTRALYPAATASARASPPPGPPSAASYLDQFPLRHCRVSWSVPPAAVHTMGESMKCGSFRLISHLSHSTSWHSSERLLGEGRGFLGLILLFGSGLVKLFSAGEEGALLKVLQDFACLWGDIYCLHCLSHRIVEMYCILFGHIVCLGAKVSSLFMLDGEGICVAPDCPSGATLLQ